MADGNFRLLCIPEPNLETINENRDAGAQSPPLFS